MGAVDGAALAVHRGQVGGVGPGSRWRAARIQELMGWIGLAFILYGFLKTHRPFVWVWKLSYSLYLWHWPLIVFGRMQADLLGYPSLIGSLLLPGHLERGLPHGLEMRSIPGSSSTGD